MKKIVLAGLLAVGALAFSQQQASAWINTRFSVGLNWGWQSGGNNLLWGAWKNGQPPGPESFGGGGYAPSYAPQSYAPQSFSAPTPQVVPQSYYPQQAAPAQPAYYGPYQFANYPRPIYYYPTPSYFYYYGQ